jgi:hypothetical protein
VSGARLGHEVGGKIRDVRGAVVGLDSNPRDLELDFKGADFNGDEKYQAYLVCEFPNGDRYSFYLSRSN